MHSFPHHYKVIAAGKDDGSVQTFHGYRVLHSDILHPGKGGIRYHRDLIIENEGIGLSEQVEPNEGQAVA